MSEYHIVGYHIFLAALVLGILSLPFLPTIIEWLRPRDIAPLALQRNELNSLTFFADSFRSRLQDLRGIDFQNLNESDSNSNTLSGPGFSVIAKKNDPAPAYQAAMIRALKRSKHIVMFLQDAQLPSDSSTLADVYGQRNMTVGSGAKLRACLVEGDIVLKSYVSVYRWIHARQIQVESNVNIDGRITAAEKITFFAPAIFARAGAPSICFGDTAYCAVPAPLPTNVKMRQVINGDVLLDETSTSPCDFVIRGACTLATRTSLIGSLKSYGNLQLSTGCYIAGSLVSKKNIVIDADCAILGPIISFEDIIIGPNCRIGRPDASTTLICRNLFIAPGCVVHGVISTQKTANFITPKPIHVT